ncbi:MAG: DUF2851 family protein [Bacteroidales bacterium]|nr:DUF2851 family protein [Bacteroidales bacterium]
MKENFLAYLWRYRLLVGTLITTAGEAVQIIRTGDPNTDSGPDYFNAIIEIGSEKWSGNVEFHIRSSDWYRHTHHTDAAYNNVILHVVYEADQDTINQAGQSVPVLCITPYFDESLFYRYEAFLNSKESIPCKSYFKFMSKLTVSAMTEKALVERLTQKAKEIDRIYILCNQHLEQTFYYLLAGCFGLKSNVQAFEMMARVLPLDLLMKHNDRIDQMEAMMYGVAGMLDDPSEDEYVLKLKSEFDFLQHKYGLVKLQPHIWKYMRMRPVSFPGIRIAQFAALLSKFPRLLNMMPGKVSYEQLLDILDVTASAYWDNHYRFGQLVAGKPKQTGHDFKLNLIINAIIPYYFWRSSEVSSNGYLDLALNLLEETPAESNSVIKTWKIAGAKVKHAFDSQGLYGLKTKYCDLRRCLDCRIFSEIIHRS